MYFRRGSLNAKNGGEYGELGARKGVSVKAESRGLSLERRNFSRTKVYEAPGEVPHASNLGTRGDRVRGISRFQTSQGYIVRRYLKKKKKRPKKHMSPWFVGGPRKPTLRVKMLDAQVWSQLEETPCGPVSPPSSRPWLRLAAPRGGARAQITPGLFPLAVAAARARKRTGAVAEAPPAGRGCSSVLPTRGSPRPVAWTKTCSPRPRIRWATACATGRICSRTSKVSR